VIRAATIAVVLASCQAKVVDLGRDAGVDSTTSTDASTCTCRINSCRAPSDCTLIGGTCGADQFCVGQFATCSTDAQCQAITANSVCTKAADSTTPCH
jgi:hypothetical protein